MRISQEDRRDRRLRCTQPSDILNAGQRVVGIAAYCKKLRMNRAAEERPGDFLAHQVSCDVIREGQCGVEIHGKPSKAERMLERLLLYDHLKKIQWYQPNPIQSRCREKPAACQKAIMCRVS